MADSSAHGALSNARPRRQNITGSTPQGRAEDQANRLAAEALQRTRNKVVVDTGKPIKVHQGGKGRSNSQQPAVVLASEIPPVAKNPPNSQPHYLASTGKDFGGLPTGTGPKTVRSHAEFLAYKDTISAAVDQSLLARAKESSTISSKETVGVQEWGSLPGENQLTDKFSGTSNTHIYINKNYSDPMETRQGVIWSVHAGTELAVASGYLPEGWVATAVEALMNAIPARIFGHSRSLIAIRDTCWIHPNYDLFDLFRVQNPVQNITKALQLIQHIGRWDITIVVGRLVSLLHMRAEAATLLVDGQMTGKLSGRQYIATSALLGDGVPALVLPHLELGPWVPMPDTIRLELFNDETRFKSVAVSFANCEATFPTSYKMARDVDAKRLGIGRSAASGNVKTPASKRNLNVMVSTVSTAPRRVNVRHNSTAKKSPLPEIPEVPSNLRQEPPRGGGAWAPRSQLVDTHLATDEVIHVDMRFSDPAARPINFTTWEAEIKRISAIYTTVDFADLVRLHLDGVSAPTYPTRSLISLDGDCWLSVVASSTTGSVTHPLQAIISAVPLLFYWGRADKIFALTRIGIFLASLQCDHESETLSARDISAIITAASSLPADMPTNTMSPSLGMQDERSWPPTIPDHLMLQHYKHSDSFASRPLLRSSAAIAYPTALEELELLPKRDQVHERLVSHSQMPSKTPNSEMDSISSDDDRNDFTPDSFEASWNDDNDNDDNNNTKRKKRRKIEVKRATVTRPTTAKVKRGCGTPDTSPPDQKRRGPMSNALIAEAEELGDRWRQDVQDLADRNGRDVLEIMKASGQYLSQRSRVPGLNVGRTNHYNTFTWNLRRQHSPGDKKPAEGFNPSWYSGQYNDFVAQHKKDGTENQMFDLLEAWATDKAKLDDQDMPPVEVMGHMTDYFTEAAQFCERTHKISVCGYISAMGDDGAARAAGGFFSSGPLGTALMRKYTSVLDAGAVVWDSVYAAERAVREQWLDPEHPLHNQFIALSIPADVKGSLRKTINVYSAPDASPSDVKAPIKRKRAARQPTPNAPKGLARPPQIPPDHISNYVSGGQHRGRAQASRKAATEHSQRQMTPFGQTTAPWATYYKFLTDRRLRWINMPKNGPTPSSHDTWASVATLDIECYTSEGFHVRNNLYVTKLERWAEDEHAMITFRGDDGIPKQTPRPIWIDWEGKTMATVESVTMRQIANKPSLANALIFKARSTRDRDAGYDGMAPEDAEQDALVNGPTRRTKPEGQEYHQQMGEVMGDFGGIVPHIEHPSTLPQYAKHSIPQQSPTQPNMMPYHDQAFRGATDLERTAPDRFNGHQDPRRNHGISGNRPNDFRPFLESRHVHSMAGDGYPAMVQSNHPTYVNHAHIPTYPRDSADGQPLYRIEQDDQRGYQVESQTYSRGDGGGLQRNQTNWPHLDPSHQYR